MRIFGCFKPSPVKDDDPTLPAASRPGKKQSGRQAAAADQELQPRGKSGDSAAGADTRPKRSSVSRAIGTLTKAVQRPFGKPKKTSHPEPEASASQEPASKAELVKAERRDHPRDPRRLSQSRSIPAVETIGAHRIEVEKTEHAELNDAGALTIAGPGDRADNSLERERIKRKARRLVTRIGELPASEREAICAELASTGLVFVQPAHNIANTAESSEKSNADAPKRIRDVVQESDASDITGISEASDRSDLATPEYANTPDDVSEVSDPETLATAAAHAYKAGKGQMAYAAPKVQHQALPEPTQKSPKPASEVLSALAKARKSAAKAFTGGSRRKRDKGSGVSGDTPPPGRISQVTGSSAEADDRQAPNVSSTGAKGTTAQPELRQLSDTVNLRKSLLEATQRQRYATQPQRSAPDIRFQQDRLKDELRAKEDLRIQKASIERAKAYIAKAQSNLEDAQRDAHQLRVAAEPEVRAAGAAQALFRPKLDIGTSFNYVHEKDNPYLRAKNMREEGLHSVAALLEAQSRLVETEAELSVNAGYANPDLADLPELYPAKADLEDAERNLRAALDEYGKQGPAMPGESALRKAYYAVKASALPIKRRDVDIAAANLVPSEVAQFRNEYTDAAFKNIFAARQMLLERAQALGEKESTAVIEGALGAEAASLLQQLGDPESDPAEILPLLAERLTHPELKEKWHRAFCAMAIARSSDDGIALGRLSNFLQQPKNIPEELENSLFETAVSLGNEIQQFLRKDAAANDYFKALADAGEKGSGEDVDVRGLADQAAKDVKTIEAEIEQMTAHLETLESQVPDLESRLRQTREMRHAAEAMVADGLLEKLDDFGFKTGANDATKAELDELGQKLTSLYKTLEIRLGQESGGPGTLHERASSPLMALTAALHALAEGSGGDIRVADEILTELQDLHLTELVSGDDSLSKATLAAATSLAAVPRGMEILLHLTRDHDLAGSAIQGSDQFNPIVAAVKTFLLAQQARQKTDASQSALMRFLEDARHVAKYLATAENPAKVFAGLSDVRRGAFFAFTSGMDSVATGTDYDVVNRSLLKFGRALRQLSGPGRSRSSARVASERSLDDALARMDTTVGPSPRRVLSAMLREAGAQLSELARPIETPRGSLGEEALRTLLFQLLPQREDVDITQMKITPEMIANARAHGERFGVKADASQKRRVADRVWSEGRIEAQFETLLDRALNDRPIDLKSILKAMRMAMTEAGVANAHLADLVAVQEFVNKTSEDSASDGVRAMNIILQRAVEELKRSPNPSFDRHDFLDALRDALPRLPLPAPKRQKANGHVDAPANEESPGSDANESGDATSQDKKVSPTELLTNIRHSFELGTVAFREELLEKVGEFLDGKNRHSTSNVETPAEMLARFRDSMDAVATSAPEVEEAYIVLELLEMLSRKASAPRSTQISGALSDFYLEREMFDVATLRGRARSRRETTARSLIQQGMREIWDKLSASEETSVADLIDMAREVLGQKRYSGASILDYASYESRVVSSTAQAFNELAEMTARQVNDIKSGGPQSVDDFINTLKHSIAHMRWQDRLTMRMSANASPVRTSIVRKMGLDLGKNSEMVLECDMASPAGPQLTIRSRKPGNSSKQIGFTVTLEQPMWKSNASASGTAAFFAEKSTPERFVKLVEDLLRVAQSAPSDSTAEVPDLLVKLLAAQPDVRVRPIASPASAKSASEAVGKDKAVQSAATDTDKERSKSNKVRGVFGKIASPFRKSTSRKPAPNFRERISQQSRFGGEYVHGDAVATTETKDFEKLSENVTGRLAEWAALAAEPIPSAFDGHLRYELAEEHVQTLLAKAEASGASKGNVSATAIETLLPEFDAQVNYLQREAQYAIQRKDAQSLKKIDEALEDLFSDPTLRRVAGLAVFETDIQVNRVVTGSPGESDVKWRGVSQFTRAKVQGAPLQATTAKHEAVDARPTRSLSPSPPSPPSSESWTLDIRASHQRPPSAASVEPGTSVEGSPRTGMRPGAPVQTTTAEQVTSSAASPERPLSPSLPPTPGAELWTHIRPSSRRTLSVVPVDRDEGVHPGMRRSVSAGHIPALANRPWTRNSSSSSSSFTASSPPTPNASSLKRSSSFERDENRFAEDVLASFYQEALANDAQEGTEARNAPFSPIAEAVLSTGRTNQTMQPEMVDPLRSAPQANLIDELDDSPRASWSSSFDRDAYWFAEDSSPSSDQDEFSANGVPEEAKTPPAPSSPIAEAAPPTERTEMSLEDRAAFSTGVTDASPSEVEAKTALLEKLIEDNKPFLKEYLQRDLPKDDRALQDLLLAKVRSDLGEFNPEHMTDEYPTDPKDLLEAIFSAGGDRVRTAFTLLKELNVLLPDSSKDPERRLQQLISDRNKYISDLRQEIKEARELLRKQMQDAPIFDDDDEEFEESNISDLLFEARGLADSLSRQGSEIFRAFSKSRESDSNAKPTEGDRAHLRELAVKFATLRNLMKEIGWKLKQAELPSELNTGSKVADIMEHFEIGWASGTENICWFHAMAQLYFKFRSTDDDDDDDPMLDAAKTVRKASDLLGLSVKGEEFDFDDGAMDILAHHFGLRVHIINATEGFETPVNFDGDSIAGPSNSSGKGQTRNVFILVNNHHFVPLWPRAVDVNAPAPAAPVASQRTATLAQTPPATPRAGASRLPRSEPKAQEFGSSVRQPRFTDVTSNPDTLESKVTARSISELIASSNPAEVDFRKKIFSAAFQREEDFANFLQGALGGSVTATLEKPASEWSVETFHAMFIAAWLRNPTEKGTYLIPLSEQQAKQVEKACNKLTRRLSSHLEGPAWSASPNFNFLQGYNELLVQIPVIEGKPHLFLKAEGHTTKPSEVFQHLGDWAHKAMTGEGRVASPNLHALSQRRWELIEGRAAENFSKVYSNLLTNLDLRGKTVTVHQMAARLFWKTGYHPTTRDTVATMTNNELGRELRDFCKAMSGKQPLPSFLHQGMCSAVYKVVDKLLRDPEHQHGRVFMENIATPEDLDEVIGSIPAADESNSKVPEASSA